VRGAEGPDVRELDRLEILGRLRPYYRRGQEVHLVLPGPPGRRQRGAAVPHPGPQPGRVRLDRKATSIGWIVIGSPTVFFAGDLVLEFGARLHVASAGQQGDGGPHVADLDVGEVPVARDPERNNRQRLAGRVGAERPQSERTGRLLLGQGRNGNRVEGSGGESRPGLGQRSSGPGKVSSSLRAVFRLVKGKCPSNDQPGGSSTPTAIQYVQTASGPVSLP